jgi:hypothetical protein
MMSERRIFEYTAPYGHTLGDDDGQQITVITREDGSLHISVREEQAVDSYNQWFDCSIRLPPDQVAHLLTLLAPPLTAHKEGE